MSGSVSQMSPTMSVMRRRRPPGGSVVVVGGGGGDMDGGGVRGGGLEDGVGMIGVVIRCDCWVLVLALLGRVGLFLLSILFSCS